jgi:hypothetical protein
LLPGYTVIGIALGGIYAGGDRPVLIHRVGRTLTAQGAVSIQRAGRFRSRRFWATAAVGLLAAIVAGGAPATSSSFTIRPLRALGTEQM